MVENMGGGVPDPANKPPSLTTSGPIRPSRLPDAATLTASATDDGLPKPYRRAPSNPDRDSAPQRPRGVQIKWTQYRGPGKVSFDPAASAVVLWGTGEVDVESEFQRSRHLCASRDRESTGSYTRVTT